MRAGREPILHVRLAFEADPAVFVEAATEGDEQRLRVWLAGSRWGPLVDALLNPAAAGGTAW